MPTTEPEPDARRSSGPDLCLFCRLTGRPGVAGPTRDVFICFDCIVLADLIRRESLGTGTP